MKKENKNAREKCVEAIKDLLNEYDAYYFVNKHDNLENNTHKEQFYLLSEILGKDEMSLRAINWIKNCYDCYDIEQFSNEEDTAFTYLNKQISELEVE